MQRKYRIWLLAGPILLVSIIFFLHRPATTLRKSKPDSTASAGSLELNPTPLPPERLAFVWTPGTSRSYDLELSTEVISDSPANPQTVIRGTYHTLVLDGFGDGGIYMTTILTDAEYHLSGQRMGLLEDLFEQVPCVIVFERSGKIRRTILPDYVKGEDETMLRGLNNIQVVLPGRRTREWQTLETDDNGETAVSYMQISSDSMRKQRLRYTKLNIIGVESPDDIVFRESLFNARLGENWIDLYTGGETISYGANKAEMIRVRYRVSLEKRITDDLLPPALEMLRGMSASQVIAHIGRDSPPIIHQAGADGVSAMVQRLIEKENLSGVSLESALAGIRDALAAADDSGSDVEAIELLAKVLRNQPQKAFEVLKVLETEVNGSPHLSAALIHALELSGTNPESQQALAAITGDIKLERFNEQMIAQAAFAAAGLGEIQDKALMNNLFELAFGEVDDRLDRARNNSVLSLGILSEFFPDIQKSLADQFDRILSQEDAMMADRKITALMSMENGAIRDPRIEAHAKEIFTRSPDADLRVCALKYLGTIEENMPMVRRALKESNEGIQRAAAGVLANRDQVDEESVNLMLGLLNDASRSNDLRSNVAFELDALRDKNPSIEPAFEILVQQLQKETSSLVDKENSGGGSSKNLLESLKTLLEEE